jgi:type I restriction enzyme S subunit
MEALSKGTTRRRIPGSVLRGLKFPVPPAEEQRRIADEIDILMKRCDAFEQSITNASEHLKKFRGNLPETAFRGELTAHWRQANKTSILPSYLETIDVKDIYSGLELPSTWRWVRLGAIAEITGGLTLGKRRRPGTLTIPTPYLRVANVQRGHLDLRDIKTTQATPAERDNLRLRVGDILLNEGGDRDKLGRGWVWSGEVADCIHQNHVFRARLKDTKAIPQIVSLFSNSFGAHYF